MWTYQNIFLTSKFSYLRFYNPTQKTETRTANRWELLIANHLYQSLWFDQSKTGEAVKSHLLHSSFAGAQLCCAFYHPRQTEQICRRKTIFLSHTGICWFFSSSNFNGKGHILSTGGDALIHTHPIPLGWKQNVKNDVQGHFPQILFQFQFQWHNTHKCEES